MSNINLTSGILDITKTQNGQTGANGYNAATIFLYKRASGTTAPAGPTARLTYKFSDGSLTPSSAYTGWNRTMPADNGSPCWIAVAAAISNTDTDYIETDDWTIQKLVQDGAPGTNGYNAATIYLYQRASTAPNVPTGLTYTFSTNTITGSLGSWTRVIPSSNIQKQPCYVTSAVIVSQQDSGNTLTFVQPTILTEDGKNGQDATQYVVRTNVEEILKFVNTNSTYENKIYEFSVANLQFYAYDVVEQSSVPHTVLGSLISDLDIKIMNYSLKDIIKSQSYSTYIEKLNDNVSYIFYLEIFYEKLIDGTLINDLFSDNPDSQEAEAEKEQIFNNLKAYFNSRDSINIIPNGTIYKENDDHSYDEYDTERDIIKRNGL